VLFRSSSVRGSSVWRQVDFRTGAGSVKLTLDIKSTKAANAQSKSVETVIGEFEQKLTTLGYSAE
jgi:hypothetical protein